MALKTRISIWWTGAYPIIWACEACWMYYKRWRPCRRPASPLRSTTYVESSSSWSIRCPHPPRSGTHRRIHQGPIDILIKTAGVPIGRYSGKMVEQLKDIDARWKALHQMRDSVAFAKDKDPATAYVVNAPKADVYVIEVSFQALKDKSERDYLNQLPTSFVLSDEAVDGLRAAAATIILDSPDFQQLLKDEGARILGRPVTGTTAASAAGAVTAAPAAK